jgi:hypothetical protein
LIKAGEMITTRFFTGKYIHYFILILLALKIALPGVGQYTALPGKAESTQQAVLINSHIPCQKSKSSSAQNSRICANQNSCVELYSMLTELLLFVRSISGKLYFLFIAGLLSASYQRRIDKPPKLIFI